MASASQAPSVPTSDTTGVQVEGESNELSFLTCPNYTYGNTVLKPLSRAVLRAQGIYFQPSEDCTEEKLDAIFPDPKANGKMFKPPADWACAPVFVPSEVKHSNTKNAADWVKAKEFVPQKSGIIANRVSDLLGGNSMDLTRIQEFVPRGGNMGNKVSPHSSGLGVKDWSKIKEFVPLKEAATGKCGSLFEKRNIDINKIQEFVPRNKSPMVQASTSGALNSTNTAILAATPQLEELEGAVGYSQEVCSYFVTGECRYGDACGNIHGTVCEYCNQFALHPFDQKQNDNHRRECLQEHERDMELSFAVAHSAGRTCGICYEVIMDKQPPGQQRFGILPSCNHCFCLICIRRWRQARQFENKIMRGCPECRTTSDFVVPSRLWVDSKEEKDRLIATYKGAVGKKPCRYFKNGTELCPFGNKCFYLHALQNGTVVDVGPPRRRRRPVSLSINVENPTHTHAVAYMAGVIDELESWLEFEEFLDMFADSDGDDQSDFDIYSDDFDFDMDSP